MGDELRAELHERRGAVVERREDECPLCAAQVHHARAETMGRLELVRQAGASHDPSERGCRATTATNSLRSVDGWTSYSPKSTVASWRPDWPS